MFDWLRQLAYALSLRFKSRARLEAENLVLRQQLNIAIRKLPKRLWLKNFRSIDVGLAVPSLPHSSERDPSCQTRDHHTLAP